MNVEAVIEIRGCREEVFLAIKPEEASALTEAKVYQSGDTLLLKIKADEVSDLRAALNSWLRLIKMCVEIEEVLENE